MGEYGKGVVWMVAFVLSGAAFAHIMRYGQHLKRDMAWLGATNYAAAGVICGVWWACQAGRRLGWEEPVLGVAAGVAIVSAYFFMVPCLRLSGVGISQSVSRLAVLIPVAASIVFWGERPGMWRWLGLGVALVSFPFLARGRAVVEAEQSRWRVLLLFGFFVSSGCLGIAQKAYAQAAGGGGSGAEAARGGLPGFLCFLFLTAAAVMTITAARRGRSPGFRDIAHGTVLGLSNVGANFAVIAALAHLPASVAFLTMSAGLIVVSSLAALVLWGERFNAKAVAGMSLAIAAIFLINLREIAAFVANR